MSVDLHVNRPIFLPDFKQISSVSTDSWKSQTPDFTVIRSVRAATLIGAERSDGRTDGSDEANKYFLKLCERNRLCVNYYYVTILRNKMYLFIYFSVLMKLSLSTTWQVWGSSSIAPLIPKLGDWCRWGVIFRDRSVYQCGPQRHSEPFENDNNQQRIELRFLDHSFLILVTILTELSGSQDTERTSEDFVNSTSLRNQRHYNENVIQPEMRFPFGGW